MKKVTTSFLLQLRMRKSLPWYGGGHYDKLKDARAALQRARRVARWPKSRTRILVTTVTITMKVLR